MCSYTIEYLRNIVKNSNSISDVLRNLNLNITGNSHSLIKKKIKENNIDISHFKPWSVCGNRLRKSFKEVLVLDNKLKHRKSNKILTRSLIDSGKIYECEKCKNNGFWENEKLILEVDHIDGNWKNNNINNLRLLCPNCHTIITYSTLKKKSIYRCNICKNKCSKNSKLCKSCFIKNKKYNYKLNITKEELEILVWKIPTTHIAKIFNVSDNTINNMCKKFGIKKPSRGYWKNYKYIEETTVL